MPGNGNPHPLYGADATAEQAYQNQLAAWLQINLNHHAQYNNQGHQHIGNGQQNIQAQFHHVAPQPDPAPLVVPAVQQADILVNPPLVNFTAILGAHGAAMHIGMPPPENNTVDSPMQAWTDSISSPESEQEDMIIQSMFMDVASVQNANATALQN